MITLYLTLAAVGIVLLVAQLAVGVVGGDHADASGGADGYTWLGEGLELLSVRSLSAAAAAFGLAGLGLHSAGLHPLLSLPVALVAGFSASLVVVRAQRAMLRFERDHSRQPILAIGQIATVHLTIPASHGGLGKVTLELQGHFVELPARTREPDSIASGTAVLVIDASEDGVLDVTPASALLTESPA